MPIQVNFLTAIWLFFLVFILHEVEEWNIDQFEHRNFVGLPPAATDRSARMWIGFVVLTGLIWCTAATLPGNPTIAAWIILPAIAIMLQNSLQHVFWVFYFRQYAPGVVTAVLLMIPLGGYVIAIAIEQGYVPIWYIALWTAVAIMGFVQTVRAGNKMTPLIRTINNIGIWLSDRIR
jgi:hypothetical protein